MQTTQSTRQGQNAGGLWILQAITGLLLILVLVLHMVAHHFVVEGGLRNYQQVIDYVSNPIIFALEIIFLTVVTIHAMLGLRAILFDLGPGVRARRVTNWLLAIVGLAVLVYGLWLAIAIQQVG
jgi:succinate dehydrogenase / fumarate reductase membrane anchor subunit